jgi:DNA repair protein RadC
MTIKLTKAQKIQILNGKDVFKIMKEILIRENKIDRNKEHLWIIALSVSNNIMLIELIALGTVRQVQADPMEVFSFALQKRAVKIIMVHNHPDGVLKPSAHDALMTDKMQAIGTFLNVPLIDHIIISERGYFSFADSGLLADIIRQGNFDLTFDKKDKLLANLKKLEKSNLALKKELDKLKGLKK